MSAPMDQRDRPEDYGDALTYFVLALALVFVLGCLAAMAIMNA